MFRFNKELLSRDIVLCVPFKNNEFLILVLCNKIFFDRKFMSQLKRILITGGAGFLGSYLCERLVESGHDVICVDNFSLVKKRMLPTCSNFQILNYYDTTSSIHFGLRLMRFITLPALQRRVIINTIQ